MKIFPGSAYPLGASFDGAGTNFSVFSEVAQRIEICLFDEQGRESRAELPEVTAFCRHGYLPGVGPGQRYGFRVHGPWAPEAGHLCLPAKLLLDPYAKAIAGQVVWHDAVYPYSRDSRGDASWRPNNLDSAPYVPRSVVVDTSFDWEGDQPPRVPAHESIIYEVHVKGFSMRHPGIPSELRGTYAGLAHPAAIAHWKRLGITALELLPVHQFIHDGALVARGLRNYWGYNSIGYLAPHDEYSAAGAAGQQVREWKQMVKALHREGIEVILDVVYNHTAEGNHLGPILCFRGLDNAAFYRLRPDDRRHYVDYTGTGNTLDARRPNVLQLIMDSLRYWVQEMHVDGFRFDLATTLAREAHDYDRFSPFFALVLQDPVVRRVKLIAEPWDLGEGGYQAGNFPPPWSEWNGKYRDTVRDFWRGADHNLGDFADRFTGTSSLFAAAARPPAASIDFVTAHDGFTLADLVSYDEKHNLANGEDNRDGTDDNRSWNCGVEGPTEDPAVRALRGRQQRNFLTTLLLSQGVPMLLGGDEIGRTQRGNNNAYCQDNEISWLDWQAVDEPLLRFTAALIGLRRRHPVFRRRHWFLGKPLTRGARASDIGWFRPDGARMRKADWRQGFARSLGLFLNGHGIHDLDARGQRLVDDSFYLLFNAHHEPVPFRLPVRPGWGERWLPVLDTAAPDQPEGTAPEGAPAPGQQLLAAGHEVLVAGRSILLLRRI
ncbi:MAG TPA: glycogen debranching protein GlgX [Thermoanaerobaculia bacterium]|nr:glycogen debranching protein GlgX [Thermoanaerobaculia bacterium]